MTSPFCTIRKRKIDEQVAETKLPQIATNCHNLPQFAIICRISTLFQHNTDIVSITKRRLAMEGIAFACQQKTRNQHTKEHRMSIPERYSKIYIKEIADIILREYNKPFPIDVIEIAKSYGLEVLEGDFDRTDVSGMLDMSTDKPQIIVAANDSFVRKRFSIAHEFGHFVLHYQGKPENGAQRMVSYRDNVSKMGFDIEEIEANFFAANLLMPTDEVMKLYRNGYSNREMAEYFNVSMSAMLNRIGALTNE